MLLDLLQEEAGASAQMEALVREKAAELLESGTLARAVTERLTEDTAAPIEEEPAVRELLEALFLSRNTAPVSAAAAAVERSARGRVEQRLEELSCAAGTFSWFFASGRKKAAAERAFKELAELLSGKYREEIFRIRDQIGGIKEDAVMLAPDEFRRDREAMRADLMQLYPKTLTAGGALPEVERLFSVKAELDAAVSEAESAAADSRTAVSQAVQKKTAKEVLEILSGIPVEAFSRKLPGVRVKILREGGFSTAADVYASSRWNLEALSGISGEAADRIKECAQEFAAEAGKRIRLRLSADDRNEETTAIVQALVNCKRSGTALAKLHDALREQDGQAAVGTARLGNGVNYLFANEKTRGLFREKYRSFREQMDGDCASEVRALASGVTGEKAGAEEAWEAFSKDPVAAGNLLEDIVPGILGNEEGLCGLPEELAREVFDESFRTDGLLCELRPYQIWGVKYILHQERVLLGDEMGLGKTVQAIAAMTALKAAGKTHFLVICPAGILPNWCREITGKSTLRAVRVHGAEKREAFASWMKNGGCAVTTYETTDALSIPEEFRFDLLVVDEAHYIKNPGTKRSFNARRIGSHTERMLFMTGTALENRVDEMLSLIDILQPETAEKLRRIAFLSSAPQFREAAAPVYYRRKREDVLRELPDKIETQEWCILTDEEEKLYEAAVLSGNYARARQTSWLVPDLSRSSKAERLLSLLLDAEQEGRKVLVFSFFLEPLRRIRELLGEKCLPPITGAVAPNRRQQIIEAFDAAPAGAVLPAQIQAGGTGLNIQSASVVILCEPQLKPSAENQAISRAYRMGQARKVLVCRLLNEDTVDERIMEMLADKQDVFNAFADESAAAGMDRDFGEIGNQTFSEIMQEEAERIRAKYSCSSSDSLPFS